MHLRIGTRASALAQWQAEWVAARLRQLAVDVELVLISTHGDRHQGPIGEKGDTSSAWDAAEGPSPQMEPVPFFAPGVFTKEIQRALLEGRIDLTVHSLKDLPTDASPGLVLAAVPARESVWDALVCREHASLDDLPAGARIGTGSHRRRAQLLHVRPDLQMRDIRGNVDTRLHKLQEGQYEAIVLAEAGLRRLDRAGEITQTLPPAIVLPAIGQGALGLETRDEDAPTREVLRSLDDPATHAAVTAERAMLAALRGGCLAPVAAWGRLERAELVLTGRVLGVDGRDKIEATLSAPPGEADVLGRRVADRLLAAGAGALIASARSGDS